MSNFIDSANMGTCCLFFKRNNEIKALSFSLKNIYLYRVIYLRFLSSNLFPLNPRFMSIFSLLNNVSFAILQCIKFLYYFWKSISNWHKVKIQKYWFDILSKSTLYSTYSRWQTFRWIIQITYMYNSRFFFFENYM